MPFTSLGFSPAILPALLRSLAEKDYLRPTAIQTAAIPAILQGRDVLASAQTGSGKTAAFALPLLQQLSEAPVSGTRRVRALILVPTRELAAQVGEVMVTLGKYLPQRIKVAVVFGGVSINPQMMNLRSGADIMVATPGRLLDLIDHNALNLGSVNTLVLDEADRLLDLGFGEELGRILGMLPVQRQTLFFSATFPPAIEALAQSLLSAPLRIEVAATPQAAPDIVQRAIEVDPPRRTQLLRHLVQTEKWERVLVFVATKHAAEIVADKLRKADIEAEPFHGELSQGKRTQVLQDFKAKAVQVVVATDVAARGIDIAQMSVVVNYDLPRSAVDYTHRIGRTGRAGESGMAISFVSASTEAHFRLIEKRQGLSVAREQIAGFEALETQPVNAADPLSNGGIKGKRPSKKDKLRAAAAAAAAERE
ncbi:Superfamily II DNA and RNA helicase [Polaromonas sp. OV174]|uniref:DEAD/DEAH box helicase n=1 Tax=Polaromonas sp. OV174 TaxID=1855300 RepID=UPI0008E9C6AC|nr:DEAD/DEAH box helicase [Polaromonas sp. OV174]SFC67026.1 Superfamily II DNA and RNA helicase [Polaromonas sp. OV174]